MKSINRHELEEMNESNDRDFVLINVLPREDFRKEHIRTSINIPHEDDDFTRQVEKVSGGMDRNVIVYCANFDCPASANAAKKLDDAGFRHVYDYEGGTSDWIHNHH